MSKAILDVKLINLDVLRKQLEEYRKTTIVALVKAWVERFVSLIADYARADYGHAVSVDYNETAPENGGVIAYEVTAQGKAVVFLEFGAGVDTDEGHDYAPALTAETGIEVSEGSWSRSADGSGMFAQYGWWKFAGIYYRGIRPRRALLLAVQRAVATMERSDGNNEE